MSCPSYPSWFEHRNWTLVKKNVMKILVLLKAGNFLASWATIRFLRMTVFHVTYVCVYERERDYGCNKLNIQCTLQLYIATLYKRTLSSKRLSWFSVNCTHAYEERGLLILKQVICDMKLQSSHNYGYKKAHCNRPIYCTIY